MMAEGKKFNWTFEKKEAIWFSTTQDVEEFANDYFKEFKGWYVGKVQWG